MSSNSHTNASKVSSNEKLSSHEERKSLKEDVVKYMSSVPNYLQKLEKSNNVQEKALNFGVLDWSRLEKWTYLQKQTPNIRGLDSPSSTVLSSSTSVSTFEVSSQSTKFSNSPLSQANQNSEIDQMRRLGINGISYDKFQPSGSIASSASALKGKSLQDFVLEDENTKHVRYDSVSSNNGKCIEESRKSCSGKFSNSDCELKINQHPIPHSCPFPSCNLSLSERAVNSCEDNVASSSSSRRQKPLRRILDPLAKTKNQIDRNQEGISRDKLPMKIELTSEDKPHMLKQALLKLVWKNGLPLFLFTTKDNNIFAATIGKGSVNRSYTIFSACEIKKRGGFWTSQANKSKNHDLIYTVVAQMKVSSSEREFVLYGNELSPLINGCVNSQFNSELAAVINKVPIDERVDNCVLLQSNFVAIIPNGVHGSSSDGHPPSLIERWRSGGNCDCGGWDEGCHLTVLTEKIQEKMSSGSQACSIDGTLRIELFAQGEDRDSKHAFKITAFSEGACKVEFGESITLLQAFAMCIAILHKKKRRTLSGIHYSMKSYVPNHPPQSPIGRD